jgi:hypothetical protein
MLAEVISFGGYVKERRKHTVRLEQDDNKPKVAVIVKVSQRGKDGRWTYATFDSFNVVEATPEEVATAVDKAFGRKSNRK